jgi:hypothetical protein
LGYNRPSVRQKCVCVCKRERESARERENRGRREERPMRPSIHSSTPITPAPTDFPIPPVRTPLSEQLSIVPTPAAGFPCLLLHRSSSSRTRPSSPDSDLSHRLPISRLPLLLTRPFVSPTSLQSVATPYQTSSPPSNAYSSSPGHLVDSRQSDATTSPCPARPRRPRPRV